jgi:hypothetical protein
MVMIMIMVVMTMMMMTPWVAAGHASRVVELRLKGTDGALRLFSGDTLGVISVWDLAGRGSALLCATPSHSVCQIQWLKPSNQFDVYLDSSTQGLDPSPSGLNPSFLCGAGSLASVQALQRSVLSLPQGIHSSSSLDDSIPVLDGDSIPLDQGLNRYLPCGQGGGAWRACRHCSGRCCRWSR